jgi:hypothetical protein
MFSEGLTSLSLTIDEKTNINKTTFVVDLFP